MTPWCLRSPGSFRSHPHPCLGTAGWGRVSRGREIRLPSPHSCSRIHSRPHWSIQLGVAEPKTIALEPLPRRTQGQACEESHRYGLSWAPPFPESLAVTFLAQDPNRLVRAMSMKLL